MLKNQHLLLALAALGVVNVLAFLGLVSGERDSARALQEVRHEVSTARAEHAQALEALNRQNQELQAGLGEARTQIGQLREELDTARDRLNRTRKALAAVEERLDKAAPPATDGKGDRP